MTPPDPLVTGPPDVPSGEHFVNMLERHEATRVSSGAGTLPGIQDPLSSEHQASPPPDVLVVHWDLRHLPFASPPALPPLEYSAALWAHARRLLAPHEPYAAVHWRMETVDPGALPDCADALVDTL
ncbi:uncharacterized protein PHACADRAFT_253150, partial [Phanerochaete carnosa HHB-10118-sp]